MVIPKREEIKKRRKELGMSKCELSKKAGLPNNAIYRIERGESEFTYPIRAKAIAEALECQIEDIFICK